MKLFPKHTAQFAFRLLCGSVWLVFTACGTCKSGAGLSFHPEQNGFAYPNELKWAYQIAPDGSMHSEKREPPPSFYHHCFPMVRSAREFFYHARFAPDAPRLDAAEYKKIIAAVTDRDSRCPSPPGEKILIPGFANLHEFSAAFPNLLKKGCGSVRASYFQRGNWRMVFPFSRHGQAIEAAELESEIHEGFTPIVHLTNFPTHTINHVILLYAVSNHDGILEFRAYDPNNPEKAARLSYGNRHFSFEQNQYFKGGNVNVYEVYKSLLY
jgi:hypothetical protein